MQLEQIILRIPKDATASEKWIMLSLFLSLMNKKAARKAAGVSLRRVQQVTHKYAALFA